LLTTKSGLFKKRLAKSSTADEKVEAVAEKSKIWQLAGTLLIIHSVVGKKPSLIISSTSSTTKNFKLLIWKLFSRK
jgi:hypothetical protein